MECKRIPAHKAILCARSKKFADLFKQLGKDASTLELSSEYLISSSSLLEMLQTPQEETKSKDKDKDRDKLMPFDTERYFQVFYHLLEFIYTDNTTIETFFDLELFMIAMEYDLERLAYMSAEVHLSLISSFYIVILV